jgi:hypothetical protein
MPTFDRFDICEAYACLEWDWNSGGWVRERPSNARRREATSVQLSRLGFKPRPNLSTETLTENGREIYDALCERYGFKEPNRKWRTETVTLPAYLASALINGDVSGLEDDDMKWLKAAEDYVAPGRIVSCDGESYFSHTCDLWGHPACDVLEYTVMYDGEES